MKITVKHALFIVIIISFIASYFFPGVGESATIETSITFIGILFGIILGFFITDLYSRFQGIRNSAAVDSSSLTTYWSLLQILIENKRQQKWVEKQRKLIKKYVHKFMPLPWERYGETEPEFSAIFSSLKELKLRPNIKQDETYALMLTVLCGQSDAREKLVMYGKDKLSWGEWLVVLLLGVLLIGSLFYTKDTSMISIIFTGALTSSILILLLVLRDLNNLNFGENAVSIEPYERVLDAIGEKRYFKTKGKFLSFKLFNKKK